MGLDKGCIFYILIWICINFFPATAEAAETDSVKASVVYNDEIPQMIISEINNAEESIDVMIFKFDYKPIADALINAQNEGRKVRAVIDARSGTFNVDGMDCNIFEYLSENGIEVYEYNDSPNILHYKIVAIDGKIVLTGSENFFTKDIKYNYEMFLKIESEKAYEIINEQFNNLLADERTKSIHFPLKEEITDLQYIKEGSLVEPFNLVQAEQRYLLFSPESSAAYSVIAAIKEAKKRIVLLEFSFSDKDIAEELIRAKKRGVEVYVLTNIGNDDINMYLVDNDIKVTVYDSDAAEGVMHYKTILIDEDKVFTGTLNLFERSLIGDREIMMLIESRELNASLNEQWEYICRDNYCKQYIGISDKYRFVLSAVSICIFQIIVLLIIFKRKKNLNE